jgi:hypothetical protein
MKLLYEVDKEVSKMRNYILLPFLFLLSGCYFQSVNNSPLDITNEVRYYTLATCKFFPTLQTIVDIEASRFYSFATAEQVSTVICNEVKPYKSTGDNTMNNEVMIPQWNKLIDNMNSIGILLAIIIGLMIFRMVCSFLTYIFKNENTNADHNLIVSTIDDRVSRIEITTHRIARSMEHIESMSVEKETANKEEKELDELAERVRNKINGK